MSKIKQWLVTRFVTSFAERLAYQPGWKVQRIIAALANLTSLCHEQMRDGDWDSTEKRVFCQAAVGEIMTIIKENDDGLSR